MIRIFTKINNTIIFFKFENKKLLLKHLIKKLNFIYFRYQYNYSLAI